MTNLRITYGCPRCHGAPMFEDIDGHYQAAHPGKTYRQDRDVLAAPGQPELGRSHPRHQVAMLRQAAQETGRG